MTTMVPVMVAVVAVVTIVTVVPGPGIRASPVSTAIMQRIATIHLDDPAFLECPAWGIIAESLRRGHGAAGNQGCAGHRDQVELSHVRLPDDGKPETSADGIWLHERNRDLLIT